MPLPASRQKLQWYEGTLNADISDLIFRKSLLMLIFLLKLPQKYLPKTIVKKTSWIPWFQQRRFFNFKCVIYRRQKLGSHQRKKKLYNECMQYYSKLLHISASYFFPILLTSIYVRKLSLFQHIICISVIGYYIWICDCFYTVVGQVCN